jgi:hypothetical protein
LWRFVSRPSAGARKAAETDADSSGSAAAAPGAATPESFDVRRPPLDEARIEALSAQVDRLIAGEPLELNAAVDVAGGSQPAEARP